jgi:hypothetical protein
MHVSSFMSEHTAEYVLVNDLVRRLSPTYPNLIPIFFWATREGNRTAIESMQDLNLRLVTCFARRPKVERAQAHHLFMKINPELMQYRQVCAPLGIPVLAGLPMVKSLPCLRPNSACNWFNLSEFDCLDQQECYVAILRDGTAARCESNDKLVRPLTTPEIENLVSKSPLITWSQAVEHLRYIRRTVSVNTPHFPFLGGYKPFLFLVLAKNP